MRLIRLAINVLCVLSFLMTVTAVGLWVHSYRFLESADWTQIHPVSDGFSGHQVEIRFAQGTFMLTWRKFHRDWQSFHPGWEFHSIDLKLLSFSVAPDAPAFHFKSGAEAGYPDLRYFDLQLRWWFVTTLLALPPAIRFPIIIRRYFRRRRRRLTNHCRECGYDVRASTDRCPECGTPIPPKPVSEVAPA